MRRWAIVQHSGYGYGENPQFRRGLELRQVTTAQERRVREVGGVVFDGYPEADDYALAEMFPPGYDGLTPRAPGSFARRRVDGLRVYVPEPAR